MKKKIHVPEQHRRCFSKDEINAMPLRRFEGKIVLVDSRRKREQALRRLKGEAVLGFDTETKPSFKKGVSYPPALVQIATADVAYLFHLASAPFDNGLAALLADKDVVKAGVAVNDDIKDLQKLTDFDAAGIVDLGEIARELDLKTCGLRNLAANFLGFRISKSAQRSNWGKPRLSPDQIRYAATDAWVGRELFVRFQALNLLP